MVIFLYLCITGFKIRYPMKIAVPYQNGYVSDHFGHTENYSVFSVNESNTVVNRTLLRGMEGCGCRSGIAGILAREGVTVMLAGNIGAGAIRHLYEEGISVVRGCSGPVDRVVDGYLRGEVTDGGETCHQHEGCHDHQD